MADFSLDPTDYSQPSGAGVAFDPATLRRIMLAKILSGPQLAGPPPIPDSEDDASAAPVPTSGPYGAPSVTLDGAPLQSPPSRPPVGASAAPLARALAGPAPSAPMPSQPSLPPGTHYAQGPGEPLLLRDDQDALTAGGSGGMAQPPTGMQQKSFGIGNAPAAGPQTSALPPNRAGGSAGAGFATSAPAASPDEDATTSGYRAMHDSSVAAYQRAISMAQQTAGTPASAVYLKIAEDAAKQANDVNMKAIEYGKPEKTVTPGQYVLNPQTGKYEQPVPEQKSRIVPPDEAKALGMTDGVYEQDAKGNYTRVTGTEEAKDSTEIQNYKFDQQNRQANGQPPISFSDWNTQKTMYGKGERPLVDAAGKEIYSSVTGDELLKSLPPAVANHAKAIAEIREKWPSGTEQARQPQLQQALAAAQQLDNSLNQQNFPTRQQMKNSAESGSGRINVANLANNTALFHSSTLADAITALNNSDNTVYNAAINSGAGPAGGIIPGATNKADEVKQFSVARDAVANELERSFHGVGTTAEQAVKRQIDDLSVNDAPQTQLGALKAAQDLLRGKIEANEADYKDTMGDKNIAVWERDHGRPFGFITPAAQAAGDRVASMYQSVKAGKGFHGFEQPAPPTQAASPPARNVAPDVTGAPRRGVYVPGKGIQFQ